MYSQGQIYRQFAKGREVANVKRVDVLGILAFSDFDFLLKAPDMNFSGDQVAIKDWREDLELFQSIKGFYPPMYFGVSAENKDILSMVSYQFFHEEFLHMFGNLLLVLLVGVFLERKFSGLTVFTVYILGGAIAAFLFIHWQGATAAPLVGASGSLCALLGFLFVVSFFEKTRLMYVILPSPKYMGYVFVPTAYWVLWLCMMEDFSGLFSKPASLSSGVAHLVHLFGFIAGMALAYIYLELAKRKGIASLQKT